MAWSKAKKRAYNRKWMREHRTEERTLHMREYMRLKRGIAPVRGPYRGIGKVGWNNLFKPEPARRAKP